MSEECADWEEDPASPRMLSDLCPDSRYSSRSLSNCITDLLVRCDKDDDAGLCEFSMTFFALPSEGPIAAGGLSDIENENNQAQQFAMDVLRSQPSSQSNSRSNSNQADCGLADFGSNQSSAPTCMEIASKIQETADLMCSEEEENTFLRDFASTLGELPVDEISATVQYIPGSSSVSICVRPETERAHESLRRRFDAIQLVRRTLRQVRETAAMLIAYLQRANIPHCLLLL
jgi:hypothetical protein